MWTTKREDIADEIRNLGADYRQQLRDGWVHYLAEKDAASGELGQSTRADPNTQKRVVDDSE